MLGLLVYFKNPKETVNRNFFKVVFWTMVWISSNFLENELVLRKYSHLLLKVDFATAIILAYYFRLFCINFPIKIKFSLIKKTIISLPALLLFVLSFSPLVIRNINFNFGFINFERGILYWLYALVVFGYIGAGSLNLSFRLRKMAGIERMQTIYILLGMTLSAVSAIFFNLILTQISSIPTEINRLGIYGILFFVVFSAYAILRHRLFNIKVIATELLTFTIWVFLLIRTLLSETLRGAMIDGSLLILVIIFGILLIKSVIREVEQRERLEVMNKKLEELNKQKSEFLSFASHQVKAPMAIVKGFAQLIYEGDYGAIPDKVKETSKKIINSANKMIALVENLLDMRKIEEGKMEYNFAEVEINKLVGGIVEDLRPLAQDKNLDLNFTGLTQEIKIKADAQKLSQVFQNFIDNAIKYTDQGWIKVGIKKEDTDGPILIIVSDSGRGISAELRHHLFEQFSRDSETAKEIQGTGLGLYIAKQIVEAHHGKIWAESDGPNKGATFFVELPIK
jgi:signal transduction histidine kinase